MLSTEPRRGFARQMARKLLKKYGVKTPPVRVEEIIRGEGYSLELVSYPDDTSGESWWEAGAGHICVNRRHHLHRRRFTLAHELGHLVMRHSEQRLRDLSALSVLTGAAIRGYAPGDAEGDGESGIVTDQAPQDSGVETALWNRAEPVEVEANEFAAELLMPLSMFKREWQEGAEVADLARKYRVSGEAAWWRVRGFPILKR